MKKIVLSALAIASLASCSSTPLEKASLEYKVFPKVANYKYEFNLAIPQPTDARATKFILDNDGYFAKDINQSVSNILFEEIRASNAFNTVAVLDNTISFNPNSTTIQDVRRTVGKDAILLTQINKFNANVRKLSDLDASSFVNLTVFTNITYKLILVDSETVVFLTTKDTSASKVVSLDDDFYKTVNELAQKSVKENVVSAKNDFLVATKSAVEGGSSSVSANKPLTISKEFERTEEEVIAQEEAATTQEVAEQAETLAQETENAVAQEEATEATQAPAEQTTVEETANPTQEQETATTQEVTEQAVVEETAPKAEVVEVVETEAAAPAVETVEPAVEQVTETVVETSTQTTPAVEETVKEVVETTQAN
jgi:hypothetical protein